MHRRVIGNAATTLYGRMDMDELATPGYQVLSPATKSKLATLPTMLVATPGYLAARGTPKTPADLASHDCIAGPGNFGRDSWSFSRNGAEVSVDVRGRIATNSGPGLFASVMAGLGIAMASSVMAGPEVKAGTLVQVLRGYKLPSVDVHAVFPGGPRPSAKVRALVDYLAAELQALPKVSHNPI